MPYFLVPYSQVSLPEQKQLLEAVLKGKKLSQLLLNSYVDENYVCYLIRIFRKHWEQRLLALKLSLHVFTIVQLEIATIAVREAEYKVLSFMMQFAVLIEIGIAEVCLRLARMMLERKIAFFLLKTEFRLLFGHIGSCKAV